MSVKVMALVWEADLPPMEKLVLLALADCANDEGKCWPSASTLAKKSGQGERTVRRSIRALIEKRHLSEVQRSGTSTMFTVHPCQTGTPARQAPLPLRPGTPARQAPKPSRTVNSSEAKASSPRIWPLPHGVSLQVWTDFLKSPKRRKAGMSETAYAGIVKNLRICAEHGFPPGEVLALAVERGWTTAKLEWVLNDQDQRQKYERSSNNPTADAASRILRELRANGVAGEDPDFGGANVHDHGAAGALAARGH